MKRKQNNGLFSEKKNTLTQDETNPYHNYAQDARQAAAKGQSTEPIKKEYEALMSEKEKAKTDSEKKNLANSQTQKKQAEEKLEELKANPETFKEVFKQEYIDDNANKLKSANEEKTILEEGITELNNTNVDQKLEMEEKGINPNMKLTWLIVKNIFINTAVAGSFLLFETYTLGKVLEFFLHERPYIGYLIAGFISSLTLITSHLCGEEIYNNRPKGAFVWLILGLPIIATTITARYFISEEFTPEIIVLSILISTSYFINIAIVRHIQSSLEKIRQVKAFQAGKKEISKETKKLIKVKSTIKTIEENADDDAKKTYNDVVSECKNTIETSKKQEDISNNNIQLIKDDYAAKTKVGIAKIQKDTEKGKAEMPRILKTVFMFLLVGSSIIFTACEKQVVKTTNIVIPIDVSKSVLKDTISMAKLSGFVWKKLDIDTIGFQNKGYKIYMIPTGSEITPAAKIAELKAKKGDAFFSNRLDRHLEIQIFKDNLDEIIESMLALPRNDQKTNIWLPLTSILEQFDASSEQHVWLISDFISDNHIIKFDKKIYKNNPKQILVDYEKLSSKLFENAKISEERTNNLEVLLFKRCSKKDQFLSYYCEKFFKRFFQEQGIKVSSKTQF